MGFPWNFPATVFPVFMILLLFLAPKMVKTQMPSTGCSFQGLGLEQCLKQGKNPTSIDQSCCIVLNQVVEAGFHCLCLLLASTYPLSSSTPLLLPLSNCFISAPPLTQCQALVPVIQPPLTPALPVLLPPDVPQEPPLVTPELPVFLPPDVPQEPPPVTPAMPVLLPPDVLQEPPPVTPALPLLLPPDSPQQPPQSSAPTDLLLPPPPPQELPLKSTSGNNSTVTPAAMQPSLNNDSAPDLGMFKGGYILISKGHKKKNWFQSRLSFAATICACMI